MASLIEELTSCLQGQLAAYKELLPISEQKTKILIANDLEALQQITEQEQLIVERIGHLERKRAEVIVNIGTVLGRNPGTLTLTRVAELMAKQPEVQQELNRLHDELKSIVTVLQTLNKQNETLIQQSLEMIEFNLNLIQSTRMLPGSNSYTKGASQLDVPAQTGMFDAKQ